MSRRSVIIGSVDCPIPAIDQAGAGAPEAANVHTIREAVDVSLVERPVQLSHDPFDLSLLEGCADGAARASTPPPAMQEFDVVSAVDRGLADDGRAGFLATILTNDRALLDESLFLTVTHEVVIGSVPTMEGANVQTDGRMTDASSVAAQAFCRPLQQSEAPAAAIATSAGASWEDPLDAASSGATASLQCTGTEPMPTDVEPSEQVIPGLIALEYQAQADVAVAVATPAQAVAVATPAQAVALDVPAALDVEVATPSASATVDVPVALDVDSFILSITAAMTPPILPSTPKLRVSQVPDYSVVPRHSTRLADKPKASNPEVQATRVMLQKFGKDQPPPTSEESGARRFRETFSGQLSSTKKEAMRELFPARRRLGSRRAAV
jgi:hypothetical protein